MRGAFECITICCWRLRFASRFHSCASGPERQSIVVRHDHPQKADMLRRCLHGFGRCRNCSVIAS